MANNISNHENRRNGDVERLRSKWPSKRTMASLARLHILNEIIEYCITILLPSFPVTKSLKQYTFVEATT